jgi:general secretion pathway protein M
MISQWYKSLEKREQYMLAFGAIAVVFYLLYGVMYLGLIEARDKYQKQNSEYQQTVEWMKGAVQTIGLLKRSGATGSAEGKSLARLAEEAAKSAQVRIARFQPKDEVEAQVWLEREDFNNVLVFLTQLEVDYGLLLEDVAISSANSPGLVNLRLKFAK